MEVGGVCNPEGVAFMSTRNTGQEPGKVQPILNSKARNHWGRRHLITPSSILCIHLDDSQTPQPSRLRKEIFT